MSSRDTYRIYVVEDNEVMRMTLQMYLDRETDLEVVGLADCGETALDEIDDLSPDLSLVDVSLSGMSGIEVTRRLHRQHPDLPVVVLSGHSATEHVQNARQAGARGYVMKGSPSTYVDAIRAVLDGDVYLSDSVTAAWKNA